MKAEEELQLRIGIAVADAKRRINEVKLESLRRKQIKNKESRRSNDAVCPQIQENVSLAIPPSSIPVKPGKESEKKKRAPARSGKSVQKGGIDKSRSKKVATAKDKNKEGLENLADAQILDSMSLATSKEPHPLTLYSRF